MPQRQLPSGTVTFVFTDIEGSTALLEGLGPDRYGELLGAHHRACRAAWEAHGGVEFGTAGDAFFVAFPTASEAVAAVQEAQRHLNDLGVRARMGVHTGQVSLSETGYVGMEVHRAARVAAAGHGGQVLISGPIAGLESVSLKDLGLHRFKDLAEPQRVYQLGEHDFPPIRSLFRSSLPRPTTRFVGREREVAELSGLLQAGGVRLVTLSGPGGTGKTRLAVQAASRVSGSFPDGAHWVALAPLRDPALILPTIAQVLDVKPQPGTDLADTLVAMLAESTTLILLDNAEHLLPELATVVGRLLEGTAGLTVLVTSRERLHVAAERVYPVLELTDTDGVTLFLERAGAAGGELENSDAVRLLCDRLDNLPLALELAAARTSLLTPQQLLERLSQRLDLLKGGRDSDPRQQTLRATIEWSHDLLAEAEQQLFAELSVFNGGCTVEAAETVCHTGPDTIQSLLDKSLLRRREAESGPRFWMLETLREFAAERLTQSGSRERVEEAHAAWALATGELAETHLRGPQQLEWMALLDNELGNLRAALACFLGRGDSDRALRLLNAVAWHLARRGQLPELRHGFTQALDMASGDARVRARALLWSGSYLSGGEDINPLREALELSRAAEDKLLEAFALEMLALSRGLPPEEDAIALLDAAAHLIQSVGAEDDAARLAINRAGLLLRRGLAEEALVAADDAVARTERLGNRHGRAVSLATKADALIRLGRLLESGRSLAEAIELFSSLGELTLHSGYGHAVAAEIAAAQGQRAVAATLVGAWDAVFENAGGPGDPLDEALRARILSDPLLSLDEDAMRAARAEGAGMTADAAAELVDSVARAAWGEGTP